MIKDTNILKHATYLKILNINIVLSFNITVSFCFKMAAPNYFINHACIMLTEDSIKEKRNYNIGTAVGH